MSKGQIPANKGRGKAYLWILAHVDRQGDDCLTWPFYRDRWGYGMLGVSGEHWWAHRLMCKLAHGEPPTPEHQAGHSCGKGHEGCVNPRHLSWKTKKENSADCSIHGTSIRHRGGNRRRLSPDQIQQIKDARGTETQGALSARFEISERTISDIWHSRSHSRPSKIKHWSPQDEAVLREAFQRGVSGPKIAKMLGRPYGGIVRMKRVLGLRSSTLSTADSAQGE